MEWPIDSVRTLTRRPKGNNSSGGDDNLREIYITTVVDQCTFLIEGARLYTRQAQQSALANFPIRDARCQVCN